MVLFCEIGWASWDHSCTFAFYGPLQKACSTDEGGGLSVVGGLGPVMHICHVFIFSLIELRAVIQYVFFVFFWRNMIMWKDQPATQFIFHHLRSTWSLFLCLCLMTLVTNPIPNIPTRALQRLCSRYICLLSWLQLVCEGETWRYLNVRLNLLWLLHRSQSSVLTANTYMDR